MPDDQTPTAGGNVKELATLVKTSDKQLTSLEAKRDQIRGMNALVLDITWPGPSCGRAPIGGNGMIIALDCFNLGHTIAHERGHNAGLVHRDDESCPPLMHGTGGHEGCLERSECVAFRRLGATDGVCTCLAPRVGDPPLLPDSAGL